MTRGNRTMAVLGLLLAAACREPPRVPIAIDLMRAGYGEVNGVAGPLPVTFRQNRRQFTQSTPGTIDVAVLLPANAMLRVKLDDDVPADAFALSVELDGRWYALEKQRLPFGEWSAKLPRGEGPQARIRLESRASQPLVWSTVIIAGQELEQPPALSADVRPRQGTPTVIVYLVDALRADHMSLYGYARDTTPRLAALARHGVVFENAYSTGPSTANAIPSLFASRYPSELGANFQRAPGLQQTLAETFRLRGYPTGAFTVNPLLQPDFGYARGFATYRLLELPPGSAEKCCPPTQAINEAALDWVAGNGDVPFFLYVHTLDVHNYAPGPQFLGRFTGDGRRNEPALPARARPPGVMSLGELYRRDPKHREAITPDRYDEAIASVDDEFGRFVDALPQKDRAIIVFTADHGEALGNEDDGSYMHGQSLHEELVRIPLVMVVPWLDRSVRVQEIVSNVDVAPTLADLMGLPASPFWRGRSWLRPTRATNPPSAIFERLISFARPEGVLGPGLYRVASWGIREDAWKLILDPEGARLFDLRTDPKETRDVHASHSWLVSHLANTLWDRSPALRETGMPPPAPRVVPVPAAPVENVPPAAQDRLRKALEALGYVE
jgi:arylsulfatase A-like enzyme